MKARHKDTGEIIELAQEGIISCDGRRYCWHQVELIPEPIDDFKPSLPSDLDEAAEEYGRNTFINECMENGVCDDHDLSDAFKAGAEWRDAQIPKLPDNVDEAAFAYENAQWEAGIKDCGYCPQDVYDAFKAGAEWMAGQGYTFETIMQEDDVDELVPTCPDMYNHGYSCGDKVIVQIRKKQ